VSSRVATAGSLIAAAAVGAAVSIAVVGGPSATATPAPLATTTATVVRTDLVQSQPAQGTLGYAPTDPVVNRKTGTYTWLPDPGTVIQRGGVLYRVDEEPVVLLAGATPAWRAFGPGMTDGADVAELQSNLVALGDARGLFSAASGHFDGATTVALQRWQASMRTGATGEVALGQVVFLPGAARVGALGVSPGQPAAPGVSPYGITTASRVVTVALSPDLPAVTVGETVSIVLPDQTTTTGTVAVVGPPAPGTASSGSGSGASGSGSAGGNGGVSGQSQTTAVATVTLDHPEVTGTGDGVGVQVALTVQSVHDVLAAPIAALLALAGGGYGLEVVAPTGGHHLVGVTTGIFTGSRVQVSGQGIDAGTKVVVAQ
jgi:hypothetical protein